MKLIIAGGRDYTLTADDWRSLDKIGNVTEVVSGKARGGDYGGEQWAGYHGIHVEPFPADWTKHGNSAGPIRNRQMAEYADAVALFPGERGTANMHKVATELGLVVYDFRK